ncbi:MAG: hypothetical protein BGP12_15230 [Rhodospirillales bacterium 70-18]|nr:TetR/AcrR family transcriptional regulator [Rhodospirillales bacterium]OJY64448.1 MAG: hypothetical protein BGP12_15230 [Rhodospirillales bacterium 70-18]
MPVARRLKSETREQLLAAAGALFVSHGYLEVTVAQICARAGVSNGSFFHLFKTKTQLAEGLIEDIACSYREEVLSRLLLPARSPEQAIAAVLNVHLRWVAGHGTRARLWFGLRPALLYLGAGPTANPHIADVANVVGEWARPLVAAGEIRPMPVEAIAALIFGGADAIGALQAGDGGAGALDRDLAKRTAAAAWGAIRGRTRVPQRGAEPSEPVLNL